MLNDRLAYDDVNLSPEEMVDAEQLWGKIFEEYDGLEKNFGALNFLSDKSKILYNYALYVQEESMLKSLLYRTNPAHIRFLRKRRYQFDTRSQQGYWISLRDNLKKVQNHLAYIQILRNKIKGVEGDSKKEGNPYDSIMAWILSNDIRVEDNITVSRYIKIKEIIQSRLKAKQKEQKSKVYG